MNLYTNSILMRMRVGSAAVGFLWTLTASCVPGPQPFGSQGSNTTSCEDNEIPPPLLSIGTVTVSTATCTAGELPGGNCYHATLSCPEVEDTGVTLKHHPATTETTLGTIILTTGGGGTSLYEEGFDYGAELVTELNAAGYATVQLAWDRGWNSGPGGVARAGCRYSTLARWIHDELHEGGASQPLCATGNSGGSAQVAYAMTRYGLEDYFDALVLSSGPPVGRLDLGCACIPGMDTAVVPCGESTLCFVEERAASINDSYIGTPCTDGCIELLAADSVVADGVDLDYPATAVVAVFGSNDNSNAIAQAMQWYDAITSDVEVLCVPEAGHGVASSVEGYQTLRDQLIAECHLQP